LRQLLQRALEIDRWAAQDLLIESLAIASALAENPAVDEVPRHLHPAVEVHRRDQRFQAIHQQRPLVAPAAHLLAAPQDEVRSELELPGDVVQMRRAHQVRFELG